MTRRRGEQCLSDLKLDRWCAGELTAAEQRAAEQHAASCDSCRSRRAELLASAHAFAAQAPPFAALGHAAPRSVPSPIGASRGAASAAQRSGRAARARWLVGSSALALAAALALVIGEPWREPDAGTGIRTKGGVARLGWVVRRGERVFAGRPDQALRAGDAVRFTISAREPVFVAIVGLGADGSPSVYFPDGETLARVEAGNDQLLPAAIALDATPDAERVYAVFCRGAERVSRVRDAIERSREAPAWPEGCSGERVSLPKEPP